MAAPSERALSTMLNSVHMAFAVSLVASALGVLYKLALRYGARAEGLPPGPPTVPWLGNLLDMPTSAPHVLLSSTLSMIPSPRLTC